VNEDRFIGPPGTGKTRALINQLDREASVYNGENVLAVSHTVTAAAELASRCDSLPQANIGTLHSFAYRAIGRPLVVETPKLMREFSEHYPEWALVQEQSETDTDVWSRAQNPGTAAFREYSLLRNLDVPRVAWPPDVVLFAERWQEFKDEVDGIDFTDMIEKALLRGYAAPNEPSAIVVDETQDLSRIQYRLLRMWGEQCRHVVSACDPDQTIFQFSGADARVFTDHPAKRQKVLSQSYRVPRAVHERAMAWIRQIPDREPVDYLPRDEQGEVVEVPVTHKQPDALIESVCSDLDEGLSVMILASCSFLLRDTITALRHEAIPYANPWRPENGAWNPLGRREGLHRAPEALRAFLSPDEAGRPWNVSEALLWLHVLKGVLVRGGRAQLEELDETTDPHEVLDLICRVSRAETQIGSLLFRPLEERLWWFRSHLAAEYENLGTFATEIARVRGAGALTEQPRLCVGTIHSVKGGEADAVYLAPDLSQAGFESWLGNSRDAVIRQFYVGMTRARVKLALLEPASCYAVDWGCVA
jgi:superfamily I DNA/RNA helicase